MNLVSIIMQMLTPELLGKLASGLGGGASQSIVQKAAGAAIPSILAGLAGVAGQSGGGSLITNAISKLDPGLMGNLGSVLGGSGQGALATTGGNILGSLLGNSAMGTLAGAVAKYSGLGGAASTGLLGALVPMVLGSIGSQQRSMGLDAGGVAKLLTDQKSNIQGALPGDFTKLLAGTGLLDGAMGQMGQAASKVAGAATSTMSSTAKSATSMARDADDAAGGGTNWLPWLIGLVALAAIAWFLAGRGTTTPPAAMAPAATPAATTEMAHSIMAGDLNVTDTINGAMGKLTAALPKITDEASAKAALPDLTAAGDAVAKVAGVADKIPADGKTAMAALIKTGMAALGPMMSSAEKDSAAGAVVKPVLDGIMDKLASLAK